MKDMLRRLWNEEEGATATEYGLIVAVVAVALIAALVLFREEIVGMFKRSGDKIKSATP